MLQSNSRLDNTSTKVFDSTFQLFLRVFLLDDMLEGRRERQPLVNLSFSLMMIYYIIMLMMILVMSTTKLMMIVMVMVVIMMMVFRAFREAGSGQFKFQFEEEMGASQSHQTIQGQPPSALILRFSLLFPPLV